MERCNVKYTDNRKEITEEWKNVVMCEMYSPLSRGKGTDE